MLEERNCDPKAYSYWLYSFSELFFLHFNIIVDYIIIIICSMVYHMIANYLGYSFEDTGYSHFLTLSDVSLDWRIILNLLIIGPTNIADYFSFGTNSLSIIIIFAYNCFSLF